MWNWLTVIIILLIVGVVLDGVRRMRQSQRSALKMARGIHKNSNNSSESGADDVDYGSELPNGGARVVTVRKPNDAVQTNNSIKKSAPVKSSRVRPQRIPQQVSLNLEEAVPMLMESVEDQADTSASTATSHEASPAPHNATSVQSELNDDAKSDFEQDDWQDVGENISPGDDDFDPLDDLDDRGRIEPRFSTGTGFGSDVSSNNVSSNSVSSNSASSVNSEGADPQQASENARKADGTKSKQNIINEPGTAKSKNKNQIADEVPNWDDLDAEQNDGIYVEPDLVLVINVMAPKGVKFSGAALLDVVLAQGLRLGNMDIFHCHSGSDGDGSVLFSMANIVVPGTFDLNTMANLLTPGVSLFLALPLEFGNSLAAFEKMLETAKTIAAELGGELKDENRSVMTQQTIEHYRQRIREFERKQLSRVPN